MMDTHDFIARYAGVYEHSPWVAEHVAPLAVEVDDAAQLAAMMADCVTASPHAPLTDGFHAVFYQEARRFL